MGIREENPKVYHALRNRAPDGFKPKAMNVVCPNCNHLFRHTKWKAKGTLKERFLHYTSKTPSGCWFWIGGLHPSGYGMLKYERVTKFAHRVSWEIFRGPIPKGMDMLHSCDNRSCVNPDHLRPGTHQENMDDMAKRGRRRPVKSDKVWTVKLDWPQVIDMRQRFENGEVTPVELAAEKSMDLSGIHKILKGQYWKV